jgi:hypothetical protein
MSCLDCRCRLEGDLPSDELPPLPLIVAGAASSYGGVQQQQQRRNKAVPAQDVFAVG